MNKPNNFMDILTAIQVTCAWLISISLFALSLILLMPLPLNAIILALVAIGICPLVTVSDELKIFVALIGFIALL
ncbi:hypothetical protein [Dulcicalothrix desertica]|uniref:hypothetical protein n=1 Tax=Dulcicalothrix desertica TaxID=32056 RepID=UPI000F8C8632|nr:hypothetical protein [Dulcicalothrix desertica]TWH43752.1 hypothetical protein CAL7102_07496 [Dulcicalothrix desertica PCC 7102]